MGFKGKEERRKG